VPLVAAFGHDLLVLLAMCVLCRGRLECRRTLNCLSIGVRGASHGLRHRGAVHLMDRPMSVVWMSLRAALMPSWRRHCLSWIVAARLYLLPGLPLLAAASWALSRELPTRRRRCAWAPSAAATRAGLSVGDRVGGVQFVIDIDFLLKIIWVDERSLVAVAAASAAGGICVGGVHPGPLGAGAAGAKIFILITCLGGAWVAGPSPGYPSVLSKLRCASEREKRAALRVACVVVWAVGVFLFLYWVCVGGAAVAAELRAGRGWRWEAVGGLCICAGFVLIRYMRGPGGAGLVVMGVRLLSMSMALLIKSAVAFIAGAEGVSVVCIAIAGVGAAVGLVAVGPQIKLRRG
jgi:hypothetical protein